jgi:GT2 family glycosyltransferase
MPPRITALVLSWNGLPYLAPCLDALLRQSHPVDDILVVDNASADGSPDLVTARYPAVRLIRNPINVGVAAGWNIGVNAALGNLLAFINQDVVLAPTWVAEVIRAFSSNSRIGIVGSKLLYADDMTIQHAGGHVLPPRLATTHRGAQELDYGQYDSPSTVDYVTGAAFAMPRHLLVRVGLFDERFHPAYYEDVDMCLRVTRAGFSTLYWPHAVARHWESTSLGRATPAFYQAYHLNRFRLAFKEFPDPVSRRHFLVSELAWLSSNSTISINESMALNLVYPAVLLEAPHTQPELDSHNVQLLDQLAYTASLRCYGTPDT